MNLNETKVYRIGNPGYDDAHAYNSDLFICLGAAKDEKNAYRRNYYKGCEIKDERLLYFGELPDNIITVWRFCSSTDKKSTSWYLTQEEAREAAKALNLADAEMFSAYLNQEMYEKLPETFHVFFELDDKGRPYARVNPHPELDGRHGKGKVFFPDRTFVGADRGSAIVSISKEFDTFGFLVGKMEQYESPSMKDFLDWAWENEKPNTKVFFVNHPGRGRYIAISEGADNFFRITNATYDFAPQQHVWKGMQYDEIVKADVERYTERECTLVELYLEDAWGEGAMEKAKELFDDTYEIFGDRWTPWSNSIKFHGQDIEKACQSGLLREYCIQGRQIEAIQVCPENLDMLVHFTYEEAKAMAEKVNKINATAKVALNQARKKGRI